MDLFSPAPRESVIEDGIEVIPQTTEDAIRVFLNRWCHRAMGDRVVAERELRDLIALAKEQA